MGAGKGLSSSSPAANAPALGEWQVRGGVAGADEVFWYSCACHPLD
eukprot:gene26783-32362_t